MSPITGTSLSQNTPSSVPTTRAGRTGGAYLESRRGHSTMIASVTTAIASAWRLIEWIAVARAPIAPLAPPDGAGAPMKGSD